MFVAAYLTMKQDGGFLSKFTLDSKISYSCSRNCTNPGWIVDTHKTLVMLIICYIFYIEENANIKSLLFKYFYLKV